MFNDRVTAVRVHKPKVIQATDDDDDDATSERARRNHFGMNRNHTTYSPAAVAAAAESG